MTAGTLPLDAELGAKLRPFDPRRDLREVADLVELCFQNTLDADGQLYIEELRRSARGGLSGLSGSLSARATQMGGYVWQEDGRVVGTLSLIPHRQGKQRVFLIANVAVHPDYRRRGIAQALTDAALADAHMQKHNKVWLQVDESNPAAIHLYQHMGFQEIARRTAWRARPLAAAEVDGQRGIRVRTRRGRDWKQQQAWLLDLYPHDLRWNLPFEENLLLPGWRGSLNRMLSDRLVHQWSAERRGRLAATLTWQSSTLSNDRLWLAMPRNGNAEAAAALFNHAFHYLPSQRSLALNLPAGWLEGTLQACGFTARRTLIWMRAD